MFRGTGTALITPFKDGAFDEDSYAKLIDSQIKGGVKALVVLGTTGESPSVSEDEREKIIKCAVRHAKGLAQIIVGTGSNSTQKAIEASQKAQSLGADGVLVVTPYYNKPTQEGLFRHYSSVAKGLSIPLIIYNVPGRTGCNILPETVVRLSSVPNIAGIKEASGDMAQADSLILKAKACRPDFKVYSGNDDQAFHLVCSGGDGVVSVLSNVAPNETSSMIRKALEGDMSGAKEDHIRLFPLMKALFAETNPMPVKYAASRLGLCSGEIRLPLVEASPFAKNLVDSAMKDLGLLK